MLTVVFLRIKITVFILISRSLAGALQRHSLPHVHLVVKSSNKMDSVEDYLLGQVFESDDGYSDRVSKIYCTEDDNFDIE